MQKIPLQRAAAGMVLARDVFRNDSPVGMPICGRHTVLSDTLIARLESLNVTTIYVQGHPVWEDGDRSFEERLAELDRRFEKVRNDPLMVKVYEMFAEHLKRSMGESGGQQAE
ncbi:MAG TPA: hypothetical protein VF795_03400 [Desulfuromonadaceae bacterium]